MCNKKEFDWKKALNGRAARIEGLAAPDPAPEPAVDPHPARTATCDRWYFVRLAAVGIVWWTILSLMWSVHK